ncbi:MAG: XRE family transcriptional regulator [bacterium]|nr:XRE family transcriptional regulator [bacterium]
MTTRIGSTLDSLLEQTGDLEEVNLRAQKKELALAVDKRMRGLRMTKSALASRMRTSRTVVDRLLDPADTSVTLATLAKASAALGCRLRIGLVRDGLGARAALAQGRGAKARPNVRY